MKLQTVILTPAPGAVFLRANARVVEMTPGEALRVAREIVECARTALSVEDGRALLPLFGLTA